MSHFYDKNTHKVIQILSSIWFGFLSHSIFRMLISPSIPQ